MMTSMKNRNRHERRSRRRAEMGMREEATHQVTPHSKEWQQYELAIQRKTSCMKEEKAIGCEQCLYGPAGITVDNYALKSLCVDCVLEWEDRVHDCY